jgi:hypothetical protein
MAVFGLITFSIGLPCLYQVARLIPKVSHGLERVNEFASYSARGIANQLRIVLSQKPVFSAISLADFLLLILFLALIDNIFYF